MEVTKRASMGNTPATGRKRNSVSGKLESNEVHCRCCWLRREQHSPCLPTPQQLMEQSRGVSRESRTVQQHYSWRTALLESLAWRDVVSFVLSTVSHWGRSNCHLTRLSLWYLLSFPLLGDQLRSAITHVASYVYLAGPKQTRWHRKGNEEG